MFMSAYHDYKRVLAALDIIIFGFDGESLKLLLIKRNFEPQFGKWSLMGGFLNENENLTDGAERILFNLTGLKNNYLEQLHTFGTVDRDPVERTLSVVYYSLVNIADQDIAAIESHNASWIDLNNKPKLIFDHDQMVEVALQRLRYKAAQHPIGLELMPQKFTLPQLQKLYEAIYNVQVDRRNFSRKVMSTDLLVATGEKDRSSITKKAQLFTVDPEKYQNYLKGYYSFFPELTQLVSYATVNSSLSYV